MWTRGSYPGAIAYVYTNDNQVKIYLCKPFFTLSKASRAGTIVHELTHEIVKTNVRPQYRREYYYQQALSLAKYSPRYAQNNADNYSQYAESRK
jgi:hypothetical protein